MLALLPPHSAALHRVFDPFLTFSTLPLNFHNPAGSTTHMAMGLVAGLIGTMLVSVYVKRRQRYAAEGYQLVESSKVSTVL